MTAATKEFAGRIESSKVGELSFDSFYCCCVSTVHRFKSYLQEMMFPNMSGALSPLQLASSALDHANPSRDRIGVGRRTANGAHRRSLIG